MPRMAQMLSGSVQQQVLPVPAQATGTFMRNELDEVALAYAITIHKSQGSEFQLVVTPLAMQPQ